MFVKLIDNLLALPSLIFFLRKSYKRQQKFMKKGILSELEEFLQTHDHDFSTHDINKISNYYGLSVPLTGDIYFLLRGKEMSEQERTALTYLGGLTGLFDDFFDEEQTDLEHIKELISNPRIDICKTAREKLFVQFYLKALVNSDEKTLKKYFEKVYHAQIASLKQKNERLTNDEILEITEQKGGVSLLFYRSVLGGELNEIERAFCYKLGLLGQLENDIFDVYKDHKAGIQTLVTTTASIDPIHSLFLQTIKEVMELIEQMNYPLKNRQLFIRMIMIIASRGIVCLDQLKRLEKNAVFNISIYDRNQLICDMESFDKIIIWFKYYLQATTILK